MAIRVFNALSNGMGGIDWAGLDVWVEKLAIEDVDGLLDRLKVIKLHQPPKDGGDAAPPAVTPR